MADTVAPDLIMMDVMMPGMAGFDACREIKANKKTASIPVIFITALNNLEDVVEGFDVGGVDLINKPFQGLEMLARVRTHLRSTNWNNAWNCEHANLRRHTRSSKRQKPN